jgi:hypothetical protein
MEIKHAWYYTLQYHIYQNALSQTHKSSHEMVVDRPLHLHHHQYALGIRRWFGLAVVGKEVNGDARNVWQHRHWGALLRTHHLHKYFRGNMYLPRCLHALLTFFLFFPQFHFACNISAIEIAGNVFSHGRNTP